MRASRRGVRRSVALLVVALFAAWGCERTPRDPDVILHKHKFDTPLVVLVMEQLARILPDDTFLKELQFGEGKVEIAGVSGNATRLVGMLERSPTFSRATFSAPTTHAPNEPGDQFHIQAQVNARYGQGE